MDVDELLTLVRKEVNLYRKLLAFEKEKMPLMIAGDSEGLEVALGEEKQIALRIRKCENSLHQVIPGRSLSELTRDLKHPYRTMLESFLDQFREIAEELKRVSVTNFRALQRSSIYTAAFLQEIFGDQISYDGSGQVRAPDSRLTD